MKGTAVQILVAVFALVLGLVIGGIGPRAQVRSLEQQLAEANECPTSTMGSEIANVFRGRPWEDEQRPRRRVRKIETPDPKPVAESAEAGEEPKDDEGGIRFEFGDGEKTMTPDELEANLDLAREALEIRYAQAREALLQDADPTPEQVQAIDDAMGRMNDDLLTLAHELTDTVNSGEEPTRRDTMAFAAETLDVLLQAEDDLRGALSEDQIGALQDESLDPMSYVDPALIDVFSELDR